MGVGPGPVDLARSAPGERFWRGSTVAQVVAIVQALIGIVLLIAGKRPPPRRCTTSTGSGPLVVFAIGHALAREESFRGKPVGCRSRWPRSSLSACPAGAHDRPRHRLRRVAHGYPRGMDEDVSAFASDFNRFLHAMSAAAEIVQASPVRDLLDRHLGDRSEVLPVVAEGYASYDHVNLQVALDAYVGAEGRTAELIGLSGQQRRWMSLSDLVATAHHAGVGIGSVDLVNLPVGPDDTLACVAFGLYLIDDHGTKLVALVRAADEQSGQAEVTLEVVCRDRDQARAMLDESGG